MPIVRIPGRGDVRFPDDMTPYQIQLAIEREILPGRGPEAISAPVRPKGGLLTGLQGIGSEISALPARTAFMVEELLGASKSPVEKAREAAAAREYGPIATRSRVAMEAAQQSGEAKAAEPEFESIIGRGLYSGASSLAQSLPGLAASAFMESKIPALANIAAITAPATYEKYRERGATLGEAALGTGLETGIEVATEAIPLGKVVNRLGKIGFGKFLKEYLGRELPSEAVATILQNAVDTAIANPNKTWADYFKELPSALGETAIATLVPGTVLAGASKAVQLAQGRPKQPAEAVAPEEPSVEAGAASRRPSPPSPPPPPPPADMGALTRALGPVGGKVTLQEPSGPQEYTYQGLDEDGSVLLADAEGNVLAEDPSQISAAMKFGAVEPKNGLGAVAFGGDITEGLPPIAAEAAPEPTPTPAATPEPVQTSTPPYVRAPEFKVDLPAREPAPVAAPAAALAPAPAAAREPAPSVSPRPVWSPPNDALPLDTPKTSDLWQLSNDELNAQLETIRAADEENLRRALGDEAYATLPKSRSKRDRVLNEMDLTPEQSSLIFGSSADPRATVDDIEQIRTATESVSPEDDADWILKNMSWAIGKVDGANLKNVSSGQGSVAEQAAFIALRNGVAALQAKGVAKGEVPALLMKMFESRGLDASDAAFMVNNFFGLSGERRGTGAPATAAPVPAIAAPTTAPAPAKPIRTRTPRPQKAATTMQARIAQIARTFKKGQNRYSFESAVNYGVDPDWLNSRADLRRMFGKEKLTRGREGKVTQNRRQIDEKLKDFADLAASIQGSEWGAFNESVDSYGRLTPEALADLINKNAPLYDPTTGAPYEQETQEDEGLDATMQSVSAEAATLGVELTDADMRAIAEQIGYEGDPAQGIVDYVNAQFDEVMAEARDYSEYDAGQEEFPNGPITNIEDSTAEPGVGGQAAAPRNAGQGQEGRKQLTGAAPGAQEGSLGLEATQPTQGGMTERQRAEMQARLQQSQMRRGSQQAFDQQEGGMFDASRDQGDMLSEVGSGTFKEMKGAIAAMQKPDDKIMDERANLQEQNRGCD